ncbi:MAG TPA: tRNA-specific adenosine deaminase [Candidatus Latescibacteria bacterium]|nr:tRNA-specific adenosine deaminase [Candidatus Latescibacterota bacterium]
MMIALAEAGSAAKLGEVPVGAAILKDGAVVGTGHNLTRTNQDPTAHAEMVAIRSSADATGSWWLENCTIYVTLEPCAMCAGALVLARLSRLVFGASDPKAGSCGSLRNIVSDKRLNHRLDVTRGVSEAVCADVLQRFFRSLRQK